MLTSTKTVGIFFVLILLFGCTLFDSGSDIVVDDYEVTWIDLHQNRCLVKKEQLVPAYVFEAGHDKRFIYVKQHPLLLNSPEKIDKSVTNYYLIERTNSEFQDKPTYGPMTKHGFDSICAHLGIQSLAFDMKYPTNLY